jgi:hypothetical protein
MARNSTGRSVARAAATGGGRTYRGARPTNWYLSVAIVVVVGVLSVLFARHQYQHKATTSATAPTVGTTWHAGFAFDICGKELASPSANVNSSLVGIYTSGNGIITIAPKNATESGNNAVLGKFVSDYHGMNLSPTLIRSPGSKLYTNGETCPSGTPDAGKKGVVLVRYWSGLGESLKQGTTVSGDPRTLKFDDGQLITMGFAPAGTKLPKPPGTVVAALLNELNSSATATTTTTPVSTVPSTTTTTPAQSTTSTTAKK